LGGLFAFVSRRREAERLRALRGGFESGPLASGRAVAGRDRIVTLLRVAAARRRRQREAQNSFQYYFIQSIVHLPDLTLSL